MRCHEQPNLLRTAVTLLGGRGRRRSPMITTPPTTRCIAARARPAGTLPAPAGPAARRPRPPPPPVQMRRAPVVRRFRTRSSPAPATVTTIAVTTTDTNPTSRVPDPDPAATCTPASGAATHTRAAAPAATTATGPSSRHVPTPRLAGPHRTFIVLPPVPPGPGRGAHARNARAWRQSRMWAGDHDICPTAMHKPPPVMGTGGGLSCREIFQRSAGAKVRTDKFPG